MTEKPQLDSGDAKAAPGREPARWRRWVSRHARRLHWPTVAALALVILSLAIDLFGTFGLKDRGDTASEYAAGMVQGPLYGGFERIGQKEIAVVLIGERSMEAFGETYWPMSYERLGQIVANLAAYKPKAIMLDFYFERPQTPRGMNGPDKDGLEFLARQIAKAEAAGIVVFAGPVNLSEPAFEPLREVLDQTGSVTGGSRSVELSFQDGREFAYPLAVEVSPGTWREMAATAIYRQWTADHAVDAQATLAALNKRSLALSWGFGMSQWAAARSPDDVKTCDGSTTWRRFASTLVLLWRLATPALHRETEEQIYYACSYFDTVPAERLDSSDAKLEPVLKDRIVFVGADIGHLADRVPTPLMGKVPGVTAHAMALDNLMAEGAIAVRYPEKRWLGWDNSDLIEVLLILLGVVAIHLLRIRRELKTDESLRLRDQMLIWFGVALVGMVIAALCHWPLFKLLGASLTGLVALSVAENLRSVLKPTPLTEDHS